MTDLRVAFHVFQSTIQTPNAAEVLIYNPSSGDHPRSSSTRSSRKLTLTAGYQGNSGVIYSGDDQGQRLPPRGRRDDLIKIFCSDGDRAHNQAIVNTTLAKGYTPQDKVNAAVKAMAPFGVSLGLVNVDLSNRLTLAESLYSPWRATSSAR